MGGIWFQECWSSGWYRRDLLDEGPASGEGGFMPQTRPFVFACNLVMQLLEQCSSSSPVCEGLVCVPCEVSKAGPDSG